MRASQYLGDGRIEMAEVEAIPPEVGEVQIRVAFAGICGTDRHILHGNMDHRVNAPQAIGHEMSGRVAAFGPGVTGLQVDDPVTVVPLLACGDCPACLAGHDHICHRLDFVGIETSGALQELWTVPASIVVPLGPEADLRSAALIEPLAVAVHSCRRARLVGGETALVLGGGPIGQLIGAVAQSQGAAVLLVEPNPVRRMRAEDLGLPSLDPLTEDLAARVLEQTSGAGADVVFEVAGIPATVLQATEHARTRGRVVMVAIHPEPVPVDVHRVFWRELELIGTRVYERADVRTAIDLLASGAVDAEAFITHTVPLDRSADAFELLDRADALKVLVDVQGTTHLEEAS